MGRGRLPSDVRGDNERTAAAAAGESSTQEEACGQQHHEFRVSLVRSFLPMHD